MKQVWKKVMVPLTAISTVGLSLGATALPAGAASKPAFTIAYEGPLTVNSPQLGLNEKFAVQLAINWANSGKTFGKLPFTLQFLPEDDQGSGTQSPTVASQLVSNSAVVAVVGPAFSGATLAAEPIFSKADLGTVSPSATNVALAHHGWKNFFRDLPDDGAQAPADAKFVAKTLRQKSVVTINDASTYGAPLATGFDSSLKSMGVKVTTYTAPGTTQCSAGTGNVDQYPALATEVKSTGIPFVFYAGYYCDFALVEKALRHAGYTGQIMSDDGSLDPALIKQAGASVANGTDISCPCDITDTGAAATFATAFKKLAGFPVGTYSTEAFDATNAIIDVMKSLGPSKLDRANIVAGLHKVVWKGISKTVKFQSDGNVVGGAIYLYKVVNGKLVNKGLE